jgi:hypothetical protein
MNIAVLYVRGSDEGLDSLVKLLGLSETSRWKLGDPLRSGKKHQSSGIKFDLADVATPLDLVHAVRHFLRNWQTKMISLSALGLESELSVGATVGDSAQFTAHFEFSVDDMFMLGTMGIALSIAAYPTSDEANKSGG